MKEAQTLQEALNEATNELQAWKAAALAAQAERDALAAQVEECHKHISNYGEISSGFDAAMWESKGREILKNALHVTAQQHLAEIRAEAIADAIKRCNIYMAFPVRRGKLADEVIAVSEIKEYAEQIRQGGAK